MSDEETDSEEIMVYVEFEEIINEDFTNAAPFFKIVGIESEKPMLQIGNHFYQGEITEPFGTFVFFEETDDQTPRIKPVLKEISENSVSYVTKTNKMINMRRIFVREKDTQIETKESDYQFPESYEAALSQLRLLGTKDKTVDQDIPGPSDAGDTKS